MKVCKKVDCIHYSNNLKCGLHDEDCKNYSNYNSYGYHNYDEIVTRFLECEEELQMVKKQLKQHKRLREENKQLKSELNDWKQRFNSSEERYKSFSQSSVECIQKKEERFKKEQNKVAECTLIDGYNCSLCGASQADIRKKYSNFCSNCGAKIKELKGESDG